MRKSVEGVGRAVNLDLSVRTHGTLNGAYRSLGVCDCLSLCGRTDYSFAVLLEGYDGGSCSHALGVRNYDGSPPSNTATQEFVVPRSIPIIFPIFITSVICRLCGP